MSTKQHTSLPEDQFSLEDIVLKVIKLKRLIVANWKIVAITTFIGMACGLSWELITRKPPVYTSKILFNMETGGSSPSGGLSDLASAFGVNTGAAPSSNLFVGENFNELLRTKNLYNRALLTKVKVKGKDEIFANYFLRKSGVRKIELEDDDEIQNFQFKHSNYKECTAMERKQLRKIQNVLMPLTNITNESKKASFVTLTVITRNDTLSYIWSYLYLKTITDFYIETKTKKSKDLLVLVENRVDSLRRELYYNQGAAAKFADQNQQVIVQQGLIQQQRFATNSSQLQSLYYEAVRSLDNMKFSMVKESPLYSIIDDAELPFPKETDRITKGTIIGTVLGLLLSILYVVFSKTMGKVKNKVEE